MDVMSLLAAKQEHRLSSPDLPPRPDLDNETYTPTYETVATLPLHRPHEIQQESPAPLPLHDDSTARYANGDRVTQPTQIIEPSSPDSLFSKSPVVQVAASSPSAPPAQRKQSIMANLMAPAGTFFKRPNVPQPAQKSFITIDSDDEGPTYKGGSSDSDDAAGKSDIKPTFSRRAEDRIEESPKAGISRFQAITSGAFYNANRSLAPALKERPNGMKRASDTMAAAYGNVSKKPRQGVPSRAMPVVVDDDEPNMDIEDITDANARRKVKEMQKVLPSRNVRECIEALNTKNGNYEDAIEYLVELGEKKVKSKHIDLTGSDDDLLMTPAQRHPTNPLERPIMNQVRQQPKKPVMSIQQKYGSTQNPIKIAPAPKKLNVFNTPEPAPAKKGRTLVRGRRDASSPGAELPRLQQRVTQTDSDDSDAGDSGIHIRSEDSSFNGRLLKFFNTCSPEDLTDTAAISLDLSTHLISKRPFRSLEAVEKVEAPNVAAGKSRRKPQPVGERICDKCREMLASYEAVDYLVKRCESIAKPLANEMKSWGVDPYSSKEGELDLVSFRESQRSCHDSGVGTPVSDEETDRRRLGGNYFGQPALMTGGGLQMKDYQIVGMNWLKLLYSKGHSCILADDMGLGKTCQVIAFIAHLLETGQKGPHLIVVPAATLENWLQEFQRFCPNINVEPYYGSQKEREEMRQTIENSRDEINVLVTTYTIAKAKLDFPWLKHFGFNCTIFDEGHYLKNADADLAKKLIRIESDFRLLLTGTPLQNNLKELISLLAFLMPKMFRDRAVELQAIFTHNVKAMDANHEALLSAQRIARARSMLTPFILRRKKNQVLKDLPKKERRVEFCNMTPEQLELYTTHFKRAMEIKARRANGENVANESANVLMKLRQAAIHPFLFRRLYRDKMLPRIAQECLKDDQWASSNPSLIVQELTAYSDMEVHNLCDAHSVLRKYALNDYEWLASGKAQRMLELLKRWMAEGHRTLIFSQFVMVLDILELVLEREAIAYFRLDGNTKVVERQDLIDEFSEEGNETPVFMLSTKAGGAGINLAKASKVIVFDSGFNPQDDIQAENRAHRIGQMKEVEVVRLVSKGTVEEQIYAMGLTKLKLDEQVAGDEDGESKKTVEAEEEEGMRKVEDMFFQKMEQDPDAMLPKIGGREATDDSEPAKAEDVDLPERPKRVSKAKKVRA